MDFPGRNFLQALSALFILLAACGKKDATSPTVKQPGLSIVAGAEATDTIEAAPAQALIVEVRGTDGELAPRTVVRFEALPSADSTRRTEPTLGVCSLTVPTCSPHIRIGVDSTDESGRAKMLIRFGHIAATARLQILVPEFGFIDTVSYTVTPGNSAHVVVEDVGLTIGSSRAARAAVLDRLNNQRPDVPTLSLSASPAATLNPATGLITGNELGNATLTARSGNLEGVGSVRVVPAGRLVVWAAGQQEILLVSTDGQSTRVLSKASHSDFGTFPRFSGNGQFVTFHRGGPFGGPANNIVVLDTTGATVRQIPTSTLTDIVSVRLLASGALMAVARAPTDARDDVSLWRVDADNVATRVTHITGAVSFYGGADIGPDGTQVAYVCNLPPFSLCALNTATSLITGVAAQGVSPKWSPTGDRIAFLDPRVAGGGGIEGTPAIVRADGTGRQDLSGDIYSPGLAWSPDGLYLIGRPSFPFDGAGLRIVRIADKFSVRISISSPYTDLYQPDWR